MPFGTSSRRRAVLAATPASHIGALVALAIAAAVLAAWTAKMAGVTSLASWIYRMNPMTAVCLALSGAALMLPRPSLPSAGASIRIALGGGVAAVGTIKLWQLAMGRQGGVDLWLFTREVVSANRQLMAPNTAIAFTLLGASLALASIGRRWAAPGSQGLAAGALAIATAGLIAYAYGAINLVEFPGPSTMALQTAVGLTAASVGALWVRPHRGLTGLLTDRSLGGAAARRLLPVVVLIVVGLGGIRVEMARRHILNEVNGVALLVAAVLITLAPAILVLAANLRDSGRRLQETNAELEIARRSAEKATAAKSMFLSNMSHELRNPLTSIIGYAELLAKRGGIDETQQRYLTRLGDASTALLATINEVLDFSKLEAGEVEIERRPTDPLLVGRQALEMFEPAMDKKGLAHTFEALGVPALVLADETRLRQILANLIGNAVKFTTVGSVGLRCTYDDAARTLRYEVIDTGPGIPPDRLDQLFQRFSQVDMSIGRTFGGTGLGLAISRGLATAMGGDVGVLTVPGEGSCFWVQIPCEFVKADAWRQPRAGETTVSHPGLRGMRLLIVDDDPSNRELVRDIVEPLGVVVSEAAGGVDAVAAARLDAFDLILMDIRMPEIDGPTAAEIIRSLPGRNASTPIVAFTGEAGGATPQPWRGLFGDVLEKPIVSADLVAMLAAHAPGAATSGVWRSR